MADLIIKPNSATGDKLILQDRAGGAVLTTADSGATIVNATLNSPTLVTPALGTPASGVMTNATGIPAAQVSGVLPAAVTGGSGLTALGTVTSGTLGAGIALAEGSVFKHVKHYGVSTYSYPGSAANIAGWSLKSAPFTNIGTDFSFDSNGVFTFPVAGHWMVNAHIAFYTYASSMGTNMEASAQIYNGSSWSGTYIRVGENLGGSGYTRGGGNKIFLYDVLSTSWQWRMNLPSAASGKTIADSTSVEFIYLGGT